MKKIQLQNASILEKPLYSRVVSHTDLTDNDLELTIVSGINYVVKNPKAWDCLKVKRLFDKSTPMHAVFNIRICDGITSKLKVGGTLIRVRK